MNSLLYKQKLASDQLTSLMANFECTPKPKSTNYLKRWISKVETLLREYLETHRAIVKKSNGTAEGNTPYFKNQDYTKFEIQCMEFLAEMEESLNTMDSFDSSRHFANSSMHGGMRDNDVKLPRITLPKFDGQYDSWPAFKDLFMTLIHRKESLSKVEKLHYLKCSLSGEAEALLRPFQVTEGNYDAACAVLLERYDNKNVLLNNQFQKLFNLKPATETSNSIKGLLDKLTQFVKNIENLEVKDVWQSMVIFLATQRLPVASRELWEQSQAATKEQSSLQQLLTFLETRFRALEATAATHPFSESRTKRHSDKGFGNTPRKVSGFHAGIFRPSCIICKEEEHPLMKCPRFIQLSISDRFTTAKRNNLCINCLSKGHLVSNCRSTHKCSKCQKNHHTMLHREISANGNTQQSSNVISSTSASSSSNHSINVMNATTTRSIVTHKSAYVLLATALVNVSSPKGTIQLRALLDQGSQASFISEDAVQQLGLRKEKYRTNVYGIGSAPQSTSGRIKVQLHLGNHEIYNLEALVLPKISNMIPNRYISINKLKNFPNVNLADPLYNIPGKIDLLLGADIYAQLIMGDIISLDDGPLLQKTRVGWIISGRLECDTTPSIQSFSVGMVEDDVSLQLRKFWELEEAPPAKPTSDDDISAENYYKATVTRNDSGRYTVRLPFKDDAAKTTLGKSRNPAISSWRAMENRMEKNPTLKLEYLSCLQEYIDSGHLVPVPPLKEDSSATTQGLYLAHHAVFKQSSTTKTRVVFDASRKTSTGVSLNDTLLTGPILQNDMLSVLIRWRFYKFAFAADIEKMYRQINVHPDDINFQRIVWRPQNSSSIKDFCLTTVTFGLTCAPFLAIRTLHQLAVDEGTKYPLAAESIFKEFYVDDVLSGGHSLEEATSRRNELTQMLQTGGFHLRKWMSHSYELLDGLPIEDIESKDILNFEMDRGYKSLGIIWHPSSDTFAYQAQVSDKINLKTTKRVVLSEIARLYDPLGWIAAIIIRAKVLMQALWKLGFQWDDDLSGDELAEWIDIRHSMKYLGDLRIPRWTSTYIDSKLEIHGFCDSSEKAYAAVIYVVSRRNTGANSHLVMAKTKVAPMTHDKIPLSTAGLTQTIPRLELCGAVLLAKLIKQFTSSLPTYVTISNTFLWTDSKIVIAWLAGHPSKWTTFVANRITQIFENVSNTPWKYVSSAQNPADVATRGTTSQLLINNQLWWNGPQWLINDEQHWPKESDPTESDINVANKEKRKTKITCLVSTPDDSLSSLIDQFSSFTRLLRVTAYCIRFRKLAGKLNTYKGFLRSCELEHVRNIYIQFIQHTAFPTEIRCLRDQVNLNSKSKLLNLNPFLEKGLLRVGGRLTHAGLSYNEKHPIILPNCRFTTLLIEHTHKSTLHGGTQLMLATIRQQYWILNARNMVKSIIHKCIACFRAKPKTSSQLMGNLPAPRVNISRPFSHVGIDYCGPFDIKDRRGRGGKFYKGYVAVFVCLAVKAIHIELVSDMTTQAFIAALKRFVSRRGLCSDIYSDCGSNFLGANAELTRIGEAQRAASEKLANKGISWHFNPPASPHFGGLWEAGVKSIKFHLYRILRNASLTYEEFTTTLAQIEACLNSRPLCPLYDDPNDASALTPAHFLIGGPLFSVPEKEVFEERLNRLDRWQLTQRLSQQFWIRWSQEYLARLQQRPKWLTAQKMPQVGDLCIVKDERFPPYRWPLAKIVALHPGKDAIVRVVTILINGNMLKRNITKLALLPAQTPHHQ